MFTFFISHETEHGVWKCVGQILGARIASVMQLYASWAISRHEKLMKKQNTWLLGKLGLGRGGANIKSQMGPISYGKLCPHLLGKRGRGLGYMDTGVTEEGVRAFGGHLVARNGQKGN